MLLMINVTYHYIPPSCFTIFYLKTAFPLTKFLLNNSHEITVSDNLIGLSEVENHKITGNKDFVRNFSKKSCGYTFYG